MATDPVAARIAYGLMAKRAMEMFLDCHPELRKQAESGDTDMAKKPTRKGGGKRG